MVCFIIALMNKAVATDWKRVERNFNSTLHSIFNQTDERFRVYVGYTDMPKMYENYNPETDFDVYNGSSNLWNNLICFILAIYSSRK